MAAIWSDPLEEHGFVGFILSTIASILCLLMFGHWLYHDWILQSKKLKIPKYKFWKLPPHSKVVALPLFFYTVYCIHSTVLATYNTFIVHGNGEFYVPMCLAHYHHNWSLFFGKTFMYLFWFVRMYQVFKNSAYCTTTKCQFIVMAVVFTIPGIVLSTVMGLSGIGAMRYVTSEDGNDWSMIHSFQDCNNLWGDFQTPTGLNIMLASIAFYSIMDIIYSIVVIRLFVSNILKLATMCPQQTKVTGDAFYLDVSIKTANLMIVTVLTNYIAFLKFSLRLPSWIFLFDVLSNFLSMYLSFAFASKYYDFIFSSCHSSHSLYGCCAKLCYSCCSPYDLEKQVSTTTMMANVVNSSEKQRKSRAATATSPIEIEIHETNEEVTSVGSMGSESKISDVITPSSPEITTKESNTISE